MPTPRFFRRRRGGGPRLLAALLGVAVTASVGHADEAFDPMAAGVDRGLAVHLGSTDGAVEAALAAGGARLVHGLALTDADRDRARRRLFDDSLYPLASVETWRGPSLPYPARMVNLLVADLDRLGPRSPSREEMLRVLVPGGVASVKSSGAWRRIAAPWPAEFDDWTHFAHGPDGNAVSREALAAPATSLKWVAGVRGQDLRIARGVVCSPLSRRFSWHEKETNELRGRDAFNGLLLWDGSTGNTGYERPLEWAAGGGLLFHFPHHQPCHAVATDLRTGRTIRTFDQGVRRPGDDQLGHGRSAGVAVQLACGDRLIQCYGRRVVALDVASGRPLWNHDAAAEVAFMSATPDGRRVFLHEVDDSTRGRARWGKHQTAAVTCLEDGKLAWRSHQLRGEELSDLVCHDDALYVFDPTTNLGDDGDANVWKLDARDGKLLWAGEPLKQNYNISLNSILIRDGFVWSWGPFNNLRRYDAATGEETDLSINGYNQRCTRLSATRDWLIFGFTSFVDREGNWTQTALGRSDCSLPAYPAHGQLLFGSNVTCHCLNPLRGIVALQPPEPEPATLDPSGRLERLDGRPGVPLPAPDVLPDGPIAAEWQPDPLVFFFLEPTTEPVAWRDLSLSAHVHRHLLVASRGNEIVWTFVAGGRIYGPPLVLGDRCYVGSADGYVYCLDAATGGPRWRFLAAPSERKVVAYSQLESAWPIYNVVAHDGTVCAAAGRHAELDGGIHVWGLDPASGEPRWNVVLHTPPRRVPAGQRSERFDRAFLLEAQQQGALNGGLASSGGRLALQSPFFDKRGSSPSTTGYFTQPAPDRGRRTVLTLAIEPAEWNGSTVNPIDLVEVPTRK